LGAANIFAEGKVAPGSKLDGAFEFHGFLRR